VIRYTAYNLVLAGISLPVSFWLAGAPSRWQTVSRSARIATLLTMLAFPWDFFAIHLNVWRYPLDPGVRIHGVPLNDLIFMWLCTNLACSVIMALDRREPLRQRNSKREYTREQYARHE
jgi:lycopene cyclase domain-containing protein